MKKLICSLLLITTFSHAQVSRVEVKSFNFNYQDPHGEGSAAVFTRNAGFMGEGTRVTVDRSGENFKLVVFGLNTEEFELTDAPALLTQAKSMEVKNFNLLFDKTIKLSLQTGNFVSPKSSNLIEGLSLDCDKGINQKETMDVVIQGCIQRMGLKAARYLSNSQDESISTLITHSIISAVDQGKGILGETSIKSADVSIVKGKYNLVASVKAQINGKVKSHGSVSYDSVTGKLTIKVDQVKFGIFPITSKVFDEMKKHENERFKVSKPYVYYTIK